MFGRKRNIQNAATIELPGAGRIQNVTYDNRANWWPVVFLALVLLIFAPLLVWWFGVGLFRAGGLADTQAEKAMANAIKSGVVILFVCGMLSVMARIFLNQFFLHRERMEEYRLNALQVTLEAERHRQLTAQAQPAISGRVSEEDSRWSQLIVAVMFKAYDYYATNGEYKGVARPWSRRNALSIPLRDGSTPTEAEAGRVRGWLEEAGIVKNDQVNIDRYPDLNAVQEYLNRLYDIPVQVMGSPALLRSNTGYKHI